MVKKILIVLFMLMAFSPLAFARIGGAILYDTTSTALGVSGNALKVNSSLPSSITHGTVVLTGTNTPQPLSVSADVYAVTVVQDFRNTGLVYIGASDVTTGDTVAGDTAGLLVTGHSVGGTVRIPIDNVSDIYVIGTVNGDLVHWIGEVR